MIVGVREQEMKIITIVAICLCALACGCSSPREVSLVGKWASVHQWDFGKGSSLDTNYCLILNGDGTFRSTGGDTKEHKFDNRGTYEVDRRKLRITCRTPDGGNKTMQYNTQGSFLTLSSIGPLPRYTQRGEPVVFVFIRETVEPQQTSGGDSSTRAPRGVEGSGL